MDSLLDLYSDYLLGSFGRVSSVNLLSCFYHTFPQDLEVPLRIPICYKTILRTVHYTDSKTGQEKRKSPITKNELLCDMFRQS